MKGDFASVMILQSGLVGAGYNNGRSILVFPSCARVLWFLTGV